MLTATHPRPHRVEFISVLIDWIFFVVFFFHTECLNHLISSRTLPTNSVMLLLNINSGFYWSASWWFFKWALICDTGTILGATGSIWEWQVCTGGNWDILRVKQIILGATGTMLGQLGWLGMSMLKAPGIWFMVWFSVTYFLYIYIYIHTHLSSSLPTTFLQGSVIGMVIVTVSQTFICLIQNRASCLLLLLLVLKEKAK